MQIRRPSMMTHKLYIIIIILLTIYSKAAFTQSGNLIIDYKTSIKVVREKLSIEKSYLIQINDKASSWISNIEIPYNDNEKLDILEASIINANGATVRKLKNKEIITRSYISDQSFYTDYLVKTFKLKWHEYPYQIKYSYKRTYKSFLDIASWSPLVYSEVPVKKASLQVELPRDYEVAIDYTDSLTYHKDALDRSVIHYWEINDMGPLQKEKLSPQNREITPKVTILPKRFHFAEQGSLETWASFGAWLEKLNEGLTTLPLSEKAKVDKLVEGVTDKTEIIKILYHYLQDNTRYINVTIDIGGLKPYPASYVCKNKYGDCKALTIYMKALLEYAGIPSYYTTIYAGRNPVKINRALPSQQFNHVILCIPLEGDTLWLENTANIFPYNYLGTFTQDRYGLLVNGENSKLIKTPALQPDDVLEKNVCHFTLDQEGNGSATINKEVTGPAFEKYKSIQYALQEEEQKLNIEKNIPLNNHQLERWSFSQSDRDEPQMQIDLMLKVRRQFRKIGDIIALKPAALNKFDFEHPNSRKYAVKINYPRNISDSMHYNLPFMEQYHYELPDNIVLDSKYGKYIQSYYKINEGFLVTREFQLFKGIYLPDQYEEFYSFIHAIQQARQQSIIVLKPLQNEPH